MNMICMPRHTRQYLVCFIFVCLCFFLESSAADQGSIAPDSLINIKEFHQSFIHPDHQPEPSLVQPQLSGKEIFFPVASDNGGNYPPDLVPHSKPSKETVVMNGSNSAQQIQDMYALNANMKRDIVFDDAQSGDPMKKGLKNSMDISINGNGQRPSNGNNWLDSGNDDGGIENMVDNAMVSKQHGDPVNYQSHTGSPEQRLGNYMNIVVSGVDVRATNTVEGGSAVATSNIIIKPVQIINCPPEVEEKLK
jgi:hypothetical protein